MNRIPWDKILTFTPLDVGKILLSAVVIVLVTKVQLVSDRLSALLIALPLTSLIRDGLDVSRRSKHRALGESRRGHLLVRLAHPADVFDHPMDAEKRLVILGGPRGELPRDHCFFLDHRGDSPALRNRFNAQVILVR